MCHVIFSVLLGLNVGGICSSPVSGPISTRIPVPDSVSALPMGSSSTSSPHNGHSSQRMTHICAPITTATPIALKQIPPQRNTISRHPLCPHVSAADQFLHWMTPYGLEKLHCISQFLPPHIIAREHVVLVQEVSPKNPWELWSQPVKVHSVL